MAEIVPNPDNVPGAVTTGYQQQNTVLYASMTGIINMNFRNNKVAAGSIFEYLGNLIKVMIDENVQNIMSMNNEIFYIYAFTNSSNIISFIARSTAPTWDEYKNGYYLLNAGKQERALIKAVRDGNNIIGVQMNNILNNVVSVTPPNSGGSQVYTNNKRVHETTHQNPGWYRFVIQSGNGGGNGSNANGITGGGGGTSTINNSINGVFYHFGGVILVHVGGSGYAGGTGGGGGGGGGGDYGGGGGGGGSGAGEESYIISGSQIYKTETIKGGNGGNGGTGSRYNGGAGGRGILDKITSNNFSISNGQGANGANNYSNINGGAGGNSGGNGGNGGNGGSIGNEGGGGSFGYGGGGGGGGGSIEGNSEIDSYGGGGGGGGGAPGWNRLLEDMSAGYVTLWYLGA